MWAGLLPGLRHVDVDGVRFSDDLTGDAISIGSPPPLIKELDEPELHLLNLATFVFTCPGSTISSISTVDVARVCTFLFSYLLFEGGVLITIQVFLHIE